MENFQKGLIRRVPIRVPPPLHTQKTGRTILALVLREMSTTFGRSPGGYLWAVLEPVAAIALLTVIFSIAFKSPALGSNFPLFYATGYLPFALFLDVTNKTAASLRFSKPLLSYPAVTFLDAILARFLLNFITHIIVAYIVLIGIFVAFEIRSVASFPHLINAFSMAGCLALGVGTFNCYLITRFQVWERVWMILTRPLFIISGVFFTPENIPEFYRGYLMWNPIVHPISEMRRGIYSTYDGTYVSPIYIYGIAAVTFAIGLILLGRYHSYLANR